MRRRLASAAAGLTVLLVATQATAAAAGPEAQPPAGTVSQDPATSGSTELSGQGQFGEAEAPPEEAGDTTEWDLSFGALLSTGNARSTAITGGTNVLVRRGRHRFLANFVGNYGRAALSTDDEPVDTVGNLQGRARYDLFLDRRWSLFAMITARHDPFQRLDLRMNVDPGAAFYVLDSAKEQMRVEAGYDFQYDLRSSSAIEYQADGTPVYDAQGNFVPLERARITHAARLAAAYTNSMSDAVSFATGLEYLQSLLEGQRWRLNWETTLSVLLVRKLSLSGSFMLRMDNDPVPQVKHLDTITSLNLVYRFL